MPVTAPCKTAREARDGTRRLTACCIDQTRGNIPGIICTVTCKSQLSMHQAAVGQFKVFKRHTCAKQWRQLLGKQALHAVRLLVVFRVVLQAVVATYTKHATARLNTAKRTPDCKACNSPKSSSRPLQNPEACRILRHPSASATHFS